MNDQQFVNAYIRILNDTINEAVNKNIVLQAQLEVSKQNLAKVPELEAKIQQLSNSSSENNSALQSQVNSLKAQLQLSNSHVETFKRELIEARNSLKNIIDQHRVEMQNLKVEHQAEILKLKSTKSKKTKKSAVNNVDIAENNLISINDTF